MITISWMMRSRRQLPAGGDETSHVYSELQLEGHPRETYRVEARATTHPVERSADIADHVAQTPRVLELECVVTPGTLDSRLEFDPDRISTVLAQIDRLIAGGIPVDLDIPGRGLFENFLLLTRGEERSVEVGDAARFTLSARELFIADLEEVTAPAPTVERARHRVDRGTQPTTNTGQETEAPQSVAASALDAAPQGLRDLGASVLGFLGGGGS